MFLGIDLGTSGVKTLLIDAEQRVIASASSPLNVSHPSDGWSEQCPSDWVRATRDAIDRLRHSNPKAFSALRGIGLSGQMHGAVLVDAAGVPLRPCILWNDTRSHREAAKLNADDRFRTITGNAVFPGFTAPKLEWVRRNEPKLFASIAKVLLPKDYLRFWLTGEYVSDVTDASGTCWLDVGRRCWHAELLSAVGLTVAQMPRLVESSDTAGILLYELAKDWGISGRVIVAGGAGDNAAAACGAGIVRQGDALLSLGTSGVLFCPVDAYRTDDSVGGVHTFCFLPTMWHQMGVILSATDSLNWLAKAIGGDSALPNDLTAELGTDLNAPSAVIFLPYLSGERTPHNDAIVRGCFIGLSHKTDRKALTQAVLEGVAFAFRDSLEALCDNGTKRPSRIVATGGGIRCAYWMKLIATVLGIAIEVPSEERGNLGAAFGAARLGMIAAEGLDPLAVCTSPPIGQRFEPNKELMEPFGRNYRRYRTLYPALRSVNE
uniref:glycerol kinase n=1 Tax=Globodera pallida TaxID=36090 RepID=A0A183CGG5_GLOPA